MSHNKPTLPIFILHTKQLFLMATASILFYFVRLVFVFLRVFCERVSACECIIACVAGKLDRAHYVRSTLRRANPLEQSKVRSSVASKSEWVCIDVDVR